MTLDINDLMASIDMRVPRYTSYPSAPHFGQLTHQTHSKWLREIPGNESLSLYIHLPFCDQMCWFCGCHTKVTNKYRPIMEMVDHIIAEIEVVAKSLGGRRNIAHIHFGGGSPSIMMPGEFSAIMHSIRRHFDIAEKAEIAMEMDPRNTSLDKIECYALEGINRASLGIQDFNFSVQKAINRIQPLSMIRRVMDLLNSVNITKISLDLIYGLPLQDLESLRQTAKTTLSLSPQRISLFAYAHMPWIKRHQKMINERDLPDMGARLSMNIMMDECFQGAGYEAIGMDHFAQPNDRLAIAKSNGRLRRNFQGYTDDEGSVLIGVGPSAISKLPQGFVQNTADKKTYEKAIMASQLASARGHEFSKEDLIFGAVIEQLMCYFSVDVAAVAERFDISTARFNPVMEALQASPVRELVRIDGSTIVVETSYRMLIRFIAEHFDQYRHIGNAKYSNIV